MSSQIDQSVLEVFEKELKDPGFSDEDARIEFFTLAKGVTREMEEAMVHLLERHRPTVAWRTQEELERVREPI